MFDIGEFKKEKFANILVKIKDSYISLNDMARKSDVTSAYISKLIALKYDDAPSPKILEKIATNSHNITSYIELLEVCGYINLADIFEYYNKTFSATNTLKAIDKTEVFDIEEKKKLINFFDDNKSFCLYNFLKDKPEELQLKFFEAVQNKTSSIAAKKTSTKTLVTEEECKVPILDYVSEDMLLLKNKRVKLNYDKERIKDYAYFPSHYMKKEFTYMAMTIKDNSMSLKFNKGDLVLVQLQETLKQDDIGLISVNNNLFIRRFKSDNDYIFLETMSNNDIGDSRFLNTKQNNIKIIGKVIAYQGKI